MHCNVIGDATHSRNQCKVQINKDNLGCIVTNSKTQASSSRHKIHTKKDILRKENVFIEKAMGTAHDSLLYLDNFLGDNNRIGFGDFKFPKCLVVKLAVVLVTVPGQNKSVVNTTYGMLNILI